MHKTRWICAICIVGLAVSCDWRPLSDVESSAIEAWLLCEDECGDEQAAADSIGAKAVGRLAGALFGPSPYWYHNMRRRAGAGYDRAGGSRTISRYEYVMRFVDNYVAVYQKRAAQSLAVIGTAEAVQELKDALDRYEKGEVNYRRDVLIEIQSAIATADSASSRDVIIAKVEELLRTMGRGIADRGGLISQMGVLGRESYNFDAGRPGLVLELLAGRMDPHNAEIGGGHWSVRYDRLREIENTIAAIDVAGGFTDAEKDNLRALLITLRALDVLLVIETRDTLGAMLGVDPDRHRPAPLVGKVEVYNVILSWLDEARALFGGAGPGGFPADLTFPTGFNGFTEPDRLTQFVNALSARVMPSVGDWAGALVRVLQSFMDESAPLDLGVYYSFGQQPGDLRNELYDPTGHILLAHPSMIADTQPGDLRIAKLVPVALDTVYDPFGYGLSSAWMFDIYRSDTASVPVIRNEELILIAAEANLMVGNRTSALDLVNVIRTAHGLAPIADPGDPGLLDEILYNRRYSLMLEGRRWLDMRRHGRLDSLPIDLPWFGPVHRVYPLPAYECARRTPKPPGC